MSNEMDMITRVNRVLERLGDATRFTSMEQLKMHGSAFFLASLQRITCKSLVGINRSPTCYEHHVHNANLFLKCLREDVHIPLPNVTAQLICSGDLNTLEQCLETIEKLQKQHEKEHDQQQLSEQQTANSDNVNMKSQSQPKLKTSNDIYQQEMEALKKWNAVLEMCGLDVVSTFRELKENASPLLVLIVEAMLGVRLDGINRKPILMDHMIENAKHAITALSHVLDRSLVHIQPQSICQGDLISLRRIADIFYEIHNALFIDAKSQSSPSSQSELSISNHVKSNETHRGRKRKHKKNVKSNAPNQRKNVKSKSKQNVKKMSNDALFGKKSSLIESNDAPIAVVMGKKKSDQSSLVYKDMLSRHVNMLSKKQEKDVDQRKRILLKAMSRKMRSDNVWMKKLELELDKELTVRAKLRYNNQDHAIKKVFNVALKLERDYIREQERLFRDQKRQLEKVWANKRTSVEKFFRDKYDMLNEQVLDQKSRHSIQEAEQLQSMRRLEAELRKERHEALEMLRKQLRSQDDAEQLKELKPEIIFDRLIKMRV